MSQHTLTRSGVIFDDEHSDFFTIYTTEQGEIVFGDGDGDLRVFDPFALKGSPNFNSKIVQQDLENGRYGTSLGVIFADDGTFYTISANYDSFLQYSPDGEILRNIPVDLFYVDDEFIDNYILDSE